MGGIGDLEFIPLPYLPWKRCNTVITACAVLLPLAWFSVFLRLWTRIKITRNFGYDDAFMIITLILYTVFTVLIIAVASKLGGRYLFPNAEISALTNMLVAIETLYTVSLAFLKLSLGFFFLRILTSPIQRKIIIWALMIFTLFSFGYSFYVMFQCGVPTGNTYWVSKFEKKCASDVSILASAYVHAALTTSTDLLFLVLPLFVVHRTRFRAREKWVVVGIMSIGAVGCAASFARMPYIPVLISDTSDFFYRCLYLAIWSNVEPALGIIAGSIAVTRPLFLKLFRATSSSQRSSARSSFFARMRKPKANAISICDSITLNQADEDHQNDAPRLIDHHQARQERLARFFGIKFDGKFNPGHNYKYKQNPDLDYLQPSTFQTTQNSTGHWKDLEKPAQQQHKPLLIETHDTISGATPQCPEKAKIMSRSAPSTSRRKKLTDFFGVSAHALPEYAVRYSRVRRTSAARAKPAAVAPPLPLAYAQAQAQPHVHPPPFPSPPGYGFHAVHSHHTPRHHSQLPARLGILPSPDASPMPMPMPMQSSAQTKCKTKPQPQSQPHFHASPPPQPLAPTAPQQQSPQQQPPQQQPQSTPRPFIEAGDYVVRIPPGTGAGAQRHMHMQRPKMQARPAGRRPSTSTRRSMVSQGTNLWDDDDGQ